MPEYQYRCENCRKEFTVELSITERGRKEKNRTIRCPKCGSAKARHVIQSVFVMTSKKS